MKKIILFISGLIICFNINAQTTQQLLDSAQKMFLNNNYSDPIPLLKKAIELSPKNATAYFYLGMAHANLKNFNQAVAYLGAAYEMDTTIHDALYNKAASNYYLEKYQEALDDYTKLIAVDKKYFAAFVGRGNILARHEKFKEAISDFTNAIALQPENPAPYRFRGSVFYNADYVERACEDWETAIALKDVQSANYKIKYCIPYFTKLAKNYSDSISKNRQNIDAYQNRAYAYSYLNDTSNSIKDLSSIITIKSDDTLSYYNRGVIYALCGNYQKAYADFNSAIQLYPNYSEAIYNHGVAAFNLNKFDEAIIDFTKIIDKNGSKNKLYQKRGNAYLKIGDKAKACEDFSKAFIAGEKEAKEMIDKNCK